MLRVGNLQRSIDFYTEFLGMKLLRTSDNPEYQYTLAFLGFGSNPEHAELELTYNYGVESYEMGTAYGHIAISVPDAAAACAAVKARGGNVTREAGPVKGGRTVIAFVQDPDVWISNRIFEYIFKLGNNGHPRITRVFFRHE